MGSPFVQAILAIAESKHAESAGSGQAWLVGLRKDVAEAELDEDCAQVLQSSINGKADTYRHLSRQDRLAAIQRALDLHGDGTATSGNIGPARTKQVRFTHTNFS